MVTSMSLQVHIPHWRRLPVSMDQAKQRCQHMKLSHHVACLKSRVNYLGRVSFLRGSQAQANGQIQNCSRRCRCIRGRVPPVSATAAATAHAPSEDRDSKRQVSLFSARLQAWDSWWSLGREPKNEKAQRARKLGSIASKLWKIMNVNGLMLTAALVCMVTFSALPWKFIDCMGNHQQPFCRM